MKDLRAALIFNLHLYENLPRPLLPDTVVITEVENGRAVDFYADPDHPVTQGWLCAKVRPYLDHVYHPDRLEYPLRRVGPKGSGAVAAHFLGRGDG